MTIYLPFPGFSPSLKGSRGRNFQQLGMSMSHYTPEPRVCMCSLSLLSYTVQGLTPGNGASHFQTSVKAIKTVPTGMPTEPLVQVTVSCVRFTDELAITVTSKVMCKRLHIGFWDATE